jgi:tetratricopeptide (TPR) repeat protein
MNQILCRVTNFGVAARDGEVLRPAASALALAIPKREKAPTPCGRPGKRFPERSERRCNALTNRRGFRLLLLLVLLAGREARILAQASSESSNDPAVIFREGKEAMQSGQLAVAEADFRRVLVLDPKSGSAHINLGVTYMREKRWDDALTELHAAQALSPDQPGILLNIGLVYYRKNDFAAAVEPFSATLRQQPGSQQARYLLGLCYFFTNQYRQATETLAPLWDQESAKLNYLYVLSIAASKSGNAALQKQAFDRMIAVGQNSPEFHLYLGKAWLAEHDTGKALEEFKAAASAQPNLPLVHYFLGRTYIEQRAYPEAEAELEKDATFEPEFAYNYEDLGILYVLLNQPEKAEKCFQEAIERNNQLVNSFFDLAKLYQDAGRYNEALAMADRAVALAPTSASVHFIRGQILKHLGQSAKANEEFQASAKLFKSFNDRLQQDPAGDQLADAQDAARE